MGDSKDFDFQVQKGILKADFEKIKKKWDRIPTFNRFDVDRSYETLINKEYEDGGGNYEQSNLNGPPDP